MLKDLLIEVYSSSSRSSSLEKKITRALQKAFVYMETKSFVEVGLVTKEEIAELNKTYRNKEGATNVLSFPEPKEAQKVGDKNHLGEIYLCPELIEEREENVVYLAIHGFLHLLGYTHKNKNDTIEMEQKEQLLIDYITKN